MNSALPPTLAALSGKQIWIGLALLLLLAGGYFVWRYGSIYLWGDDYDAMLENLYRHTVPTIDSEGYLAMVGKDDGVVLLDTRTEAEFKISHIAGAVFVDYAAFKEDPAKIAGLPASKNRPVVVYCTVGKRSENAGEKLLELGYTDVQNLYGGIFQWVNEGHPVLDSAGNQTENVHGYGWPWQRWLKKGHAVSP